MSTNADVEKLCHSSIGGELTVAEAAKLATIMDIQNVKHGDVISSEGGETNTLFVLIDGQLDVISSDGSSENVVYTMKKGECAGTRAFVDLTPRKATLRANGDAVVYTMEPSNFESLLNDHPRIVYKVMRALFRNTHTNLMRMNKETEQLSNYISKSGGRY